MTSCCFSSVIGGLLSAHLLAPRAGVTVEEGWPCQGPLLRLAVDVAERLLPGWYPDLSYLYFYGKLGTGNLNNQAQF